jgi:hypothetical protein
MLLRGISGRKMREIIGMWGMLQHDERNIIGMIK